MNRIAWRMCFIMENVDEEMRLSLKLVGIGDGFVLHRAQGVEGQ